MEFHALPLEMRFEIFSYLNSRELRIHASRVCKEWRNLAFYLMLDVELTGSQSLLDTILVIRRCNRIRNLILTAISNWWWIDFLPHWQFIRKIEFRKCKMNAANLSKLVASFPAIEAVELKFQTNDFEIIRQIVKWKRLKIIAIESMKTDIWFDGSKYLDLIATECCCLQGIEFERMTVDLRSFKELVRLRGTSLTMLKIKVDFASLFCPVINEDMYRALSILSNLKDLSIYRNYGALAARKLKHLKKLRFSFTPFYSDWTFYDFFVGVKFYQLQYIEFMCCDNLNDFGLECMTRSCPALLNLSLALCTEISDDGISAVVRTSKNIRIITLDCLPTLTKASFFRIVFDLSNLTNLNISRHFDISPYDIARAKEHKPNLQIQCKKKNGAKIN